MESVAQPQSEITLRIAEEGDKKLWVYETHDEIVEMIEYAKEEGIPMVTVNRVVGIGNPGKKFSTEWKNIVNIRDISD